MNISLTTARNAGRDGAKEAIVEIPSGRRVSFRQLEDRVARLANALIYHPAVSRGDRIAIAALNSIEYFEVYLAAARAGLLAQGINWRLATPEIERILQDSMPTVVVYSDDFSQLGEDLRRSLDLPIWLQFGPDSDGSYDAFVASGDPTDDFAPGNTDDPVLLMYTGGTTGVPKGVVHTNRSVLAAMVNNTVAEQVVPSDRYMLIGQMFHIAAVLAMNYLYHGATLVLVSKYETNTTLETIESERVTAFMGFTTMMNYMLSELGRGGGRHDLSSLRNLQYGGGPYAQSVVEQIIAAFPCGVIQNYGTSEHVGITFLDREDHDEARSGRHLERLRSGGRPAFLVELELVGDDGRPVARDGSSRGEVYVRSAANMVGYWNRPGETAALTRAGGWLGTGDIGVRDEQGYLYIVGRAKDVIISGSENVYAAEVERAIASHPSVLEAAVIGVPDATWGESVAAYVVRKPGLEVTETDVQDAVSALLGSYQKPKLVEFVDELPKSPNGKVLKQELRSVSIPAETNESA